MEEYYLSSMTGRHVRIHASSRIGGLDSGLRSTRFWAGVCVAGFKGLGCMVSRLLGLGDLISKIKALMPKDP